jgi:hypothetical protein
MSIIERFKNLPADYETICADNGTNNGGLGPAILGSVSEFALLVEAHQRLLDTARVFLGTVPVPHSAQRYADRLQMAITEAENFIDKHKQ